MAQYIDKAALVAEIERRLDDLYKKLPDASNVEIGTVTISDVSNTGKYTALELFGKFIDTLEVKEVDFWHKQSEKDIDNSFNDWSLHRFICLMKDGSIQEFTAIQDECYDGSINLHLDCVDDEYEWEYDDIIYWIEVPNIKAQKGE